MQLLEVFFRPVFATVSVTVRFSDFFVDYRTDLGDLSKDPGKNQAWYFRYEIQFVKQLYFNIL